MAQPTIDTSINLFWPSPIGPFQSNLDSLLSQASERETLLTAVCHLIQDFPYYPNVPEESLRFRAYLHLLRDFLRQEWLPYIRQGKLYLQPPKWADSVRGAEAIERHKDSIQQSLQWERDAQFGKASVQKFIAKMERERSFGEKLVSIRNLIADGEVLARKLQKVIVQSEEQQSELLAGAIQPYLQLVETGARCEHTYLFLQDIWRYFRYMWRTPYNPTPGRKMFYLVRDAAQPFHPVMGIAALGSSLVQLTVRDDKIGWTPKSFSRRLKNEAFSDKDAEQIAIMLLKTLSMALEDIDTDELVDDIEEIQHPKLETIVRLKQVEEEARTERIDWLQKRQLSKQQQPLTGNQLPLSLPDFEIDPTLPSPDECQQNAMRALYRAKRARGLWELLDARRVLSLPDIVLDEVDGLRTVWQSTDGNRTIRTLIRANKKQKVGINLMDIIICGAVPPYNTLLVGKLVAMLLASPQVVVDYRRKYAEHSSNIASRLKGEAVIRDPALVFLGTTSLYASSSSQYNRIRIPTPTGDDIRYKRYGLTKGYGSIHFLADTRTHLANLLTTTNAARLINNRFGEGVNPKLRRISAGLSAVGIQKVDKFIKHYSRRIIYGVSLCRNTHEFLRGEEDKAQYYFDCDDAEKVEQAVSHIIAYWRNRWLLPRIGKSNRMTKVRKFGQEQSLLSSSDSGKEKIYE